MVVRETETQFCKDGRVRPPACAERFTESKRRDEGLFVTIYKLETDITDGHMQRC
jgi:hypothetical protein